MEFILLADNYSNININRNVSKGSCTVCTNKGKLYLTNLIIAQDKISERRKPTARKFFSEAENYFSGYK